MAIRFDWDPAKAAYNKAQHGVAFESAITVFDDSGALENHDAAHSQTEDRFIRIGLSDVGVLVVIFAERSGKVIRIISARRANRRERRLYHDYQEHQTH